MWDVLWTDPGRELVGEHKARKSKKRSQKDVTRSAPGSRNSVSTMSSLSSADSPFGIFRSKGLKQINTTKANAAMLNSPECTSSNGRPNRSPLSQKSGSRSERSSVAALASGALDYHSDIRRRGLDSPSTERTTDNGGELSVTFSNHDSIFSRPAESDTTTFNSVGDTTNESINSNTNSNSFKTPSPLLGCAESSSAAQDARPGGRVLAGEAPMSPISPLDLMTRPSMLPYDADTPLVPPAKSPLRPAAPLWSKVAIPNNPNAWRKPEEWETLSRSNGTVSLDSVITDPSPQNSRRNSPEAVVDLKSMQRELGRMAVATPTAILSRLNNLRTKRADADEKFELTLENRRWMLSVLHHLDPVPDKDTSGVAGFKISPLNTQTVLALHESTVTASYLAALHSSKVLYHVSVAPLSLEAFPNVQPLTVPSASSSSLPVPPESFETAYSMLLPSLYPVANIPAVLRSVNESLKPGGTLQLTIVDPIPRIGTAGKTMREWLEKHLLCNLEDKSRSLSPSTVFPKWLGEASLRGCGSTLTTTKFYAMPESARRPEVEADADLPIDMTRAQREVKAELRSLAGRALWAEVWGAHVTADKWWWEDAACVEECLRLGTFWEYHLIEGVKGA